VDPSPAVATRDRRRQPAGRLPILRRAERAAGAPTGASEPAFAPPPGGTRSVATSASVAGATVSSALSALRHSPPVGAGTAPSETPAADAQVRISPSAVLPATSARTVTVPRGRTDLPVSRTASGGASEAPAALDLADLLADILNREADLRGID
jgi:hypothetical protein